MSGLIIPGGAKTTKKEEPKVTEPIEEPENLDELTPEEREEFYSRLKAAEPQGTRVVTAFVLVLGHDGQWSLSPTLDIDIVQDRIASLSDVLTGTHAVNGDVSSTIVSQKTVNLMLQQTQAMAAQARDAQLAASLGNVRV
jgi:hypothetical protein